MSLIYYKGEPYGKIEGEELQFYAVEGEPEDLPEEGKELEKIPVLNDDGTQKVTEEGKKLWKVNIPMSQIIQNANILTDMDAEYIVNKQAVDKVQLSEGTRSVLGNLTGDYVAQGFKILRGTDLNTRLKTLQPEDLYTYVLVGSSFALSSPASYGILCSPSVSSSNLQLMFKGTDSNGIATSAYCSINPKNDLSDSSFNGSSTYISGQYKGTLSCPISANPKYFGFFFYHNTISNNICSPIIYACFLNENKEIINGIYQILQFNSGISVSPSLSLSDAENSYALGLTDTYEYISEEEYNNKVNA